MSCPGLYILTWLFLLATAYCALSAEGFVRLTACTRSGEAHSEHWIRPSMVGTISKRGYVTEGDSPHKDCVMLTSPSGNLRLFVIGDVEGIKERLENAQETNQPKSR